MLPEIIGGLAIGAVLGLLGGGGALMAIPVLVYVFHYPFRMAVGSGLVLVALGVLPALVLYWRHRQIHWLSAFIMGLSGMLGARLSSQLAGWAPTSWLLGLLIALMLLSAINMLKANHRDRMEPEILAGSPHYGALAAAGLIIGILTGLVGVGGGFLLVPALLYLGRLPLRLAIPSSLVIIGLNALSGMTGYWAQLLVAQASFQWLMLSSVFGSVFGYRLSQRLSSQSIKRAFGVFLLILIGLIWAFPPS